MEKQIKDYENPKNYEIEDIGLNVDTSEYSNEEDIYSDNMIGQKVITGKKEDYNKKVENSNLSEDNLTDNEKEDKKNLKFRHNLFKAVLLIMVSIFILLIFSFFNFELSDKNDIKDKNNSYTTINKSIEGKLIKNSLSSSLMNEIYKSSNDYNLNTNCKDNFYRYNLLHHVPCIYTFEKNEHEIKLSNILKSENKTFTNSIYNGTYIDFKTENITNDFKAYEYDNFITFYKGNDGKESEFNCLLNIFSIFAVDFNQILERNSIQTQLDFESSACNKQNDRIVIQFNKEFGIRFIDDSFKKSFKTVMSNFDVLFLPNYSFYDIESCWLKSSIEKIDINSLYEMRFTINSINRNKANLLNTIIKGS